MVVGGSQGEAHQTSQLAQASQSSSRRPLLVPQNGAPAPPLQKGRPVRSRSPHFPAAAELGVAVESSANSELEEYLSKEFRDGVKLECKKLLNTIGDLQRSIEKIAGIGENIKLLSEGKYPSGIRAVTYPLEIPKLDSVELLEDLSLSLVIPAGTSMRECKRRLHIFHALEQQKLDKQLMEEVRNPSKKNQKSPISQSGARLIPAGQ